MSQEGHVSWSDATIHLIAALHAVTHRIALTDAEEREVNEAGVALSPESWLHARGLFREADNAGKGCVIDLGCTPQVLRWLGFRDEAGFAETFGCSLSVTFDAGVGCLSEVAHLVETLDQQTFAPARHALARVWCRRVRILAALCPPPLGAILESIDRALSCPPENDSTRRALLHCRAEVGHLMGDEALERSARESIDEIECSAGGRDLDAAVHAITARIVCLCWWLAHGTGLLEVERELVDLQPGCDARWAETRRALVERVWDRIPMPTAFFRHWYDPHGPIMPGWLVECLRTSATAGLLETMVSSVEVLLGGGAPEDLSAPGPSHVIGALVERRVQLEEGWLPAQGEPERIWWELHQGARRPGTLERIELIRGLQPVMRRCGDGVPHAPVSVHLDRAAEAEARGDFAAERAALEVAAALSESVSGPPPQRHHAVARLAVLTWREGNFLEAERLLAPLAGERVAKARRRIAASDVEREVLRKALETFESSPHVRSGAAVVWAHEDAGHSVLALKVARELVERFPDQRGTAQAVLGGLLFQQARCRDAVEVLRDALAHGFDRVLGEALLARAACRIGVDGDPDFYRLVLGARERGGIVIARPRDVFPTEDWSGKGVVGLAGRTLDSLRVLPDGTEHDRANDPASWRLGSPPTPGHSRTKGTSIWGMQSR